METLRSKRGRAAGALAGVALLAAGCGEQEQSQPLAPTDKAPLCRALHHDWVMIDPDTKLVEEYQAVANQLDVDPETLVEGGVVGPARCGEVMAGLSPVAGRLEAVQDIGRHCLLIKVIRQVDVRHTDVVAACVPPFELPPAA